MLTYLIGCFALIVKPGPDLMCTLATALSEGRRQAFLLMTGLIIGCWLWVLLLTLGVASLFTSHGEVMVAIQLLGMGYIAYLAFLSFREAVHQWRGNGADALKSARGAGLALLRRGVVMSLSNPLTILFFLAFLPGFGCGALSRAPDAPPRGGVLRDGAVHLRADHPGGGRLSVASCR